MKTHKVLLLKYLLKVEKENLSWKIVMRLMCVKNENEKPVNTQKGVNFLTLH